MVRVVPAEAFKIPPFSIVSLPTDTDKGNVGSLGVVEASGIITSVKSDGTSGGVQLAGFVQSVLTDPFQVELVSAVLESVQAVEPKAVGKYKVTNPDCSTQLFVVL